MPLPSEISAGKRSVVERAPAEPDSKYGKKPEERTLAEQMEHGVIVLNKPSGPTSHQTAHYLMRLLGIDKAGHSGTLDPAVTGVLPTGIGKGTRVMQALLPAGKEYIAIMMLHADVEEKLLREEVKKLTGKINQKPPARSAVKRVVRERTVYYLDILEISGREVLLRMGCQGGTYVRKWIHDLGLALDCGAHMAELIRTQAGPFKLDQAVSLQDVADAFALAKEGNEAKLKEIILPFESAVAHLPQVVVQDSAVDSICHGAVLHVPGVVRYTDDMKKEDLVAILSLKGELVGLGNAAMDADELKAATKGLVIKTDVVLMEPGTYPKFKKE